MSTIDANKSNSLPSLEQSEVKFVQAMLLAQAGPKRFVPTSPKNFQRFWLLLSRHVSSSVLRHPEDNDGKTIADIITRRTRLHSVYYRNLFAREDCEETLSSILEFVDTSDQRDLGNKLSDVFRALVRMGDIVIARLRKFREQIWPTHDGIVEK